MSEDIRKKYRFEALAADAELAPAEDKAPASLKARVYSALVQAQKASGALLSLSQSYAAGGGLCVFEQLVRIAPVGEEIKSLNPCRICHARLLTERFDHAPIYWAHCHYVAFQKK